ncbi:MAG: TatD family hydrolase [Eggerthellaceae bacterium]|nr:TatD family hydrolase [Eggerthellaceae bacterium]MCH4220554.1 TatD family hydrolase [Eggerthellaceae bacterium]
MSADAQDTRCASAAGKADSTMHGTSKRQKSNSPESDGRNVPIDPAYRYDMHCHLGFVPHPREAAEEAARRHVRMFSMTVNPAEYQTMHTLLNSCNNVRVGLGIHPWYVEGSADSLSSKTQAMLDNVLAQLPQERFVGEIGLDAGTRHSGTIEAQRIVFERIIAACCTSDYATYVSGNALHNDFDDTASDTSNLTAHTTSNRMACNASNDVSNVLGSIQQRPDQVQQRKVISIHAIRATDDVLDCLERYQCTVQNDCIIHWFSGSSDQLQRAIKLGCYFSIGTRMLQTKRGRAYVRAIPLDRLLIETDLPAQMSTNYDNKSLFTSLHNAYDEVESYRACDLTERIAHTSARLLAYDADLRK